MCYTFAKKTFTSRRLLFLLNLCCLYAPKVIEFCGCILRKYTVVLLNLVLLVVRLVLIRLFVKVINFTCFCWFLVAAVCKNSPGWEDRGRSSTNEHAAELRSFSCHSAETYSYPFIYSLTYSNISLYSSVANIVSSYM